MQLRKISIILIFLLIGIEQVWSANFIFTGHITSEGEQFDVINYPVLFSTNNDTTNYWQTYTDENGVYYMELDITPNETVTVSVFDCNEAEHYKEFLVPDSVNIADFTICINIPDCQALYVFEPDVEKPLAFTFTNLSIGNYNYNLWDFGDGDGSIEENPYHLFPEEGTYIVTLTIYDTLSPAGCFDTYSLPITVGEPTPCVADFSYTLDSLNNTPFVYIFNNESTGDSLIYFWDFSDGNYSEEESPQHTFSEEGTYDVNLSIQNITTGCYDEVRKTITTADYHDFGGQVFLGDYPINIDPDDSSNRATAYLYRKMEGKWHFMDEREFWQLGYYWFTNKLEGDYLIRVNLDSVSDAYNQYAPGYYKHSPRWQYASTLGLENDSFEESIHLTPLSPIGTGINQISGYIVLDSIQNRAFDELYSGVQIQLYNDSGNMVKYTYSDEQGNFSFDNLPDGIYKIRGELVGICSSEMTMNLYPGNTTANNAQITLFDCGSIGIEENKVSANSLSLTVFPVPANKTLSIKLNSIRAIKVDLIILNMQGKILDNRHVDFTTGNPIFMDVSQWSNGIYLINAINEDGEKITSKKFTIFH